jgi:hypothetical protein
MRARLTVFYHFVIDHFVPKEFQTNSHPLKVSQQFQNPPGWHTECACYRQQFSGRRYSGVSTSTNGSSGPGLFGTRV